MERIAAARAHREQSAANADPREVQSKSGAWSATITLQSSSVSRASIFAGAEKTPLKFSDVVALWQRDKAFAEFFASVLAASPFESYFFECPPFTKATAGANNYEHVTVRAHRRFASASPDSFAEHLSGCGAGATTFTNLGGDATLVAPCERAPRHIYGHLAAFTRSADVAQQVELWQLVGKAMAQVLDARGAARTWLNTEGSGVPWLHVRLDSTPKYYHHMPYTRGDD